MKSANVASKGAERPLDMDHDKTGDASKIPATSETPLMNNEEILGRYVGCLLETISVATR